jgi:DNA-binding Lrp family transcriptional regulator
VTHAVVLIKAERDYLTRLGGHLAEVEGVTEAYSVTGEWDFVAILRVPEGDSLATVVTERLARLPGIAKTLTMVAFEAYSKHDLESMFDLGA